MVLSINETGRIGCVDSRLQAADQVMRDSLMRIRMALSNQGH